MGNKSFFDWINLLLGIWVIISPFALGTQGNMAAQELLVILGIAVVIVAIWALSSVETTRAAEWCNVVLGIILFISPWIFNYFRVSGIAWNSWCVGFVIAVLSLANLPVGTRLPHAR